MTELRAVLFDYDDTLVKTRECKFGAIVAVAERHYGAELPIARIEEHWGIPYRTLFARLFDHLDPDTDRVIHRYEALNAEFPVVAYEDAIETIELLLARDTRVGVVTSAGEIVRQQMIAVGIPLERLVLLQTAADTQHHKPDPRVFAPALARLRECGVEPTATLYVGDSINDYRAAHGAGLGFVGVHGRTTAPAEFSRFGVKSVANLKEIAHGYWQL
jgi:HAD superfamily hydrolase (TIGR01509 family)